MTRIWTCAAVVAGVTMAAPATGRAEVRLAIANGQVNLEAKDATVRQILEEWARVGQTKFVNVERLTGAPLTLQLTNMPEAQALEILLRSYSGYLLAPRPVAVATASRFDRILVMPTSTAPRASTAATPQPAFQQPQFPPGFPQPDSLDEDTAQGPPGANPNPRGPSALPFPGGVPPGSPGAFPQRGPIFPRQAAPFPSPNGAAPTATSPVGAFPPSAGAFPTPAGVFPAATQPPGAMPVGVAVPGMVVQPVPQPSPPSQLDPQ